MPLARSVANCPIFAIITAISKSPVTEAAAIAAAISKEFFTISLTVYVHSVCEPVQSQPQSNLLVGQLAQHTGPSP